MNGSPVLGGRKLRTRLQQLWGLVQAGRYDDALAMAGELTRTAPALPDGWFAASHINFRLGRRERALRAITRANELIPWFPPWQLQELVCLEACGERARAITLGRKLLEEILPDPHFYATLSGTLFSLQQFEAARRAQQKALALQPDHAAFHLGLASIELALGDLAAARASCERCLALAPNDPEALYFHAGLGRKSPADNNVPALLEALAHPPPGRAAHARLMFALAKELEDLGRHEESFQHLARGAGLFRTTLDFDIDDEVRFLEAIAGSWTHEQVWRDLPATGHQPHSPIFVVGLPRTGTTLVERILGAHSQVRSAGELPDFGRLLGQMMDELPETMAGSRAEMVAHSTGLDFAELGRRYLEKVTPLAGGAPNFIDKLPQNALYLGLVHRALPDARLVLVWRHPMDTCYSMFKQAFANTFPFSYELEELARYYVAHQQLMRHWIEVLGRRVHVVHYEDLVADQEAESRRLLDFCGLAWEPGCLDFHRSPAPATTASASQVRNAIYRSSVGKWRHYRDGLQPLEQHLRAAGCLDDWRLDHGGER